MAGLRASEYFGRAPFKQVVVKFGKFFDAYAVVLRNEDPVIGINDFSAFAAAGEVFGDFSVDDFDDAVAVSICSSIAS